MKYIRLYDSWPLFVQNSLPFPIECVSCWYWKQDIKSLLVKGVRTIATHQEERGLLVFVFNCMIRNIEEMTTYRKIHFINLN